LFEYLETPEGLAFISEIIKYWKKKVTNQSDFPILGLAHFDPSHFIYGDVSILIEFLKDYNIYFEFNTSYSEYYSRKFDVFFKLIKEKNIPVAVGSDAHSSKELVYIDEAYEVIKIYDLESNFKLLLNSLYKKH
jgi:histidinol phosphatase-like PHP family hydrolase